MYIDLAERFLRLKRARENWLLKSQHPWVCESEILGRGGLKNDNNNILHNPHNIWKPNSKGKQTIPFYSHHANVLFLIQYISNRGVLKDFSQGSPLGWFSFLTTEWPWLHSGVYYWQKLMGKVNTRIQNECLRWTKTLGEIFGQSG